MKGKRKARRSKPTAVISPRFPRVLPITWEHSGTTLEVVPETSSSRLGFDDGREAWVIPQEATKQPVRGKQGKHSRYSIDEKDAAVERWEEAK